MDFYKKKKKPKGDLQQNVSQILRLMFLYQPFQPIRMYYRYTLTHISLLRI